MPLGAKNRPACPICDDTGWKTVNGVDKTRRVTRCDCRNQGRSQRLYKAANIPARYEHCTLSEFVTDFDGAHRSLAVARLSAGRFVEEYPIEKTGLWFSGPIGIGKTHLAVGIIQELILAKGVSCLFCDYRELLKEIQNSYNPSVQNTELEILRPVFDSEVLVLDELGANKPSEWVFDTVGYILNYRYNQKKTTIITTNFPNHSASLVPGGKATKQETLGDRITERMRSRLHEMCRLIEMDGIDFRQRVRSANFR
ncbi:MAG TPA: ATP-binding protein [Candidatus Angelobacter sp.]|nr:ATP-binding protein [Candidatus Angelobacter sp.]